MASEPDIEEIEVRLLLEAINQRYGYDLRRYAYGSIRRRVLAALSRSQLSSLGALQHKLLHDPECFAEVLDDLTVRVTEMFRDPAFYKAIRTHVVPILRTYPFLRIWLAGCASGEEAYAIAILLTEEGLYDRSQIYATDLSPRAISLARDGVYARPDDGVAVRAYRESGGVGELSDHYTEAYGRIAMKESLRRNMLFFQHELVSDQAFGEMHLVFCRNVMIYFDKTLKQTVLAKLAESLRSGGVLCLGSSERLSSREMEHGFRDLVPDARIYRYEPGS